MFFFLRAAKDGDSVVGGLFRILTSLLSATRVSSTCSRMMALADRAARKAAVEQEVIPETDIGNSAVRVWVVTTARYVIRIVRSYS